MDIKKYIDSVVGNIARKIEDEFNEADHPRDKGGKFTSAGKESRRASGFYGHGENVKKEDPKRGDELNKYAVKLEKAGVDPKEIHRLNREGDLEGMKKLLPETSKEKEAKEELKGSTKSDEEYLTQIDEVMADVEGADLPLASLMEDLGIDTEGIPDEYLRQDFEERLMGDKKLLQRTKEYVNNYRKGGALEANSKTDKLVSAALEGLMDDTDTAIDFLKGMKGSVKGLEDEDGDIDMEELGKRIERAIRNNPEDAAEMLGQLGDIYYEEDDVEDAAPKKNRLGRNPLDNIDPSEDDSLDNSLFKKTGK